MEYSFDLFQKKERSSALCSVANVSLYGEMICIELNEFLEEQELYASATLYTINKETPLAMIKLSFSNRKSKCIISNENINIELAKLDRQLWNKQGGSIYFRKKLNYYDGDDIYIIRPNQKRFWTQSAAIDDATEIILECLSWS
jgi:ribosome-interacting GTPase 1